LSFSSGLTAPPSGVQFSVFQKAGNIGCQGSNRSLSQGKSIFLFQVFLCTGFREPEVGTLAWSDIHWKEGKPGVSAKPDLDRTPKSYASGGCNIAGGIDGSIAEFGGNLEKQGGLADLARPGEELDSSRGPLL
jgi:hypothetical protein